MGREEGRFEQLLSMLPENWEAKAKELGALRRARGIKTAEGLLRLILLYLTEGKSLAGTCALAQLSGEAALCKSAVFKRIQNSARWLQWLCENIYRRADLIAEKPPWLKGREVLLIDGSEDSGKDRRYYRLHYSMELFTLSAREFLITEEKTGEKLANFKRLGENDIVIADRMYGTLPGIAHLREHRADYILRFRAGAFRITDEKGDKIEPAQQFSKLMSWNYGEIAGWCDIKGERVPLRLCAVRKDVFNEYKGIQRLKRERGCKPGGKPLSEVQKEYNKYIIVATSLGKEVSAEQVLSLYRARWQIELAFKRLKSLFEYNQMPARKSQHIKAWFYGKLLLAALCETLVNTGRFSPSADA